MGTTAAFLGLGIGTEVLAVVALLALFRRRGWMGREEDLKTFMTERPWCLPCRQRSLLRARRIRTDNLACGAWCLLGKERFGDGVVTGSRCGAAVA